MKVKRMKSIVSIMLAVAILFTFAGVMNVQTTQAYTGTYTVRYMYGSNPSHGYSTAKLSCTSNYRPMVLSDRSDARFAGWSTSYGATKPTYAVNTTYSPLTSTNGKVIDLYPVYIEQWKVVYHGTYGDVTQKIDCNCSTFKLFGENVLDVQSGDKIYGWCTNPDPAKGRSYRPGDYANRTNFSYSNKTTHLYAVEWASDQPVLFSSSGGMFVYNSTAYLYLTKNDARNFMLFLDSMVYTSESKASLRSKIQTIVGYAGKINGLAALYAKVAGVAGLSAFTGVAGPVFLCGGLMLAAGAGYEPQEIDTIVKKVINKTNCKYTCTQTDAGNIHNFSFTKGICIKIENFGSGKKPYISEVSDYDGNLLFGVYDSLGRSLRNGRWYSGMEAFNLVCSRVNN